MLLHTYLLVTLTYQYCRASPQNFTYRKLLVNSHARYANIFRISGRGAPLTQYYGNGSEIKQNPALSRKTQHTFTCTIVFHCILLSITCNVEIAQFRSHFTRISFVIIMFTYKYYIHSKYCTDN